MRPTPAVLLLAFMPVLSVCAQAPLTVDQLVAIARNVTEAGQDPAEVEMAQAVLDAAKARQFPAASRVVSQLARLLRHYVGG